eukprot:CAMPEP_0119414828 /NCGR_PEP_ID=MMETSP1335-20130426/7198_2 /TAXON_ID=259385 /ORGANISM="Chrysoculter rhomboideus, Strain RCC1486" /LENGTH=235 /DNA_ID=CAMNT_0007439723 /DNA_START=203 /DNA_END=906 /DNA_ORIENTATION=-
MLHTHDQFEHLLASALAHGLVLELLVESLDRVWRQVLIHRRLQQVARDAFEAVRLELEHLQPFRKGHGARLPLDHPNAILVAVDESESAVVGGVAENDDGPVATAASSRDERVDQPGADASVFQCPRRADRAERHHVDGLSAAADHHLALRPSDEADDFLLLVERNERELSDAGLLVLEDLLCQEGLIRARLVQVPECVAYHRYDRRGVAVGRRADADLKRRGGGGWVGRHKAWP